jgi:hypothetical protein
MPGSIVGVFVVAMLFIALFAPRIDALSSQWSSGLPNLCVPGQCPSGSGWFSMFGVSASVAYNARVVDVSNEQVIACGSEVPSGTTVRYEFIPHQYSDISWFATGGGFDSPYGDFMEGGANPPTNPCDGRYSMGRTGGGAGYGTAFGTFSVNPPTKTVSGLPEGCTTAADGVSKECKLSKAGEIPGTFNYSGTYAYMYSALRPEGGKKLEGQYYMKCLGRSIMGASGGAYPYKQAIPAKTISCPLTVIISNETPTAPVVAPTVTNATCIVGEPYSLSMTSTDPQAEDIRYGVNWDNNSSVDEFVPGSGYVPSGTTRTATRTFATPGTKTVKVLTQNTKGLTSGWTTVTFSCVTDAGEETAALFDSVSQASGIDENDVAAESDMNLRVVPSLVKSGATTKVNWSATNVQSCTVTAPNGDSWDTILSAIGGEVSRPITGETTYTLRCIDLDDGIQTKTASVKIIPVFQEK